MPPRRVVRIPIAAKGQVLVFTLTYRVRPEDIAIEEVLDKLRESGAGFISKVEVEKGEV